MVKQKTRQKDFVDKSRKIMSKYYDLLEDTEGLPPRQVIKAFKNLVVIDPDFLDPYIVMYECYKEIGRNDKAIKLLNEAYNKALELITDEQGKWPERLEWGWLENRHIIRTILNKALACWDGKENDKSLDLFRKLLRTNPNDNIGARNYILAILEGYKTFESYEEKFVVDGYYDANKCFDWFDENVEKHKEEFKWWLELMKEKG